MLLRKNFGAEKASRCHSHHSFFGALAAGDSLVALHPLLWDLLAGECVAAGEWGVNCIWRRSQKGEHIRTRGMLLASEKRRRTMRSRRFQQEWMETLIGQSWHGITDTLTQRCVL